MKKPHQSVCALLVLVALAVSPAWASFVTRSGAQLLLDGQPYRFTGINIYNANNAGLCWYPLASGPLLSDSLDQIGKGGKVIRAWFFQSLATTSGQRDWSGFDHTLAVAAAHGVRVVATLGNQWPDCDGTNGGPGSYKDEAWYTGGYTQPDAGGTVSYRDWAAEIAARYQSDPTILAWQLLNEAEVKPDAGSGSCSTNAEQILKTFAADVSALIKSVDANHLVSLGTIGGGQCGAQDAEYQDLHDLASIDLCEYHDYGSPTVPMPGDEFNGLQRRLDQCAALGKPLFVGETGIRPLDIPSSVSPRFPLSERAEAFEQKFRVQIAAGVVGELVWAWNAQGSAEDNFDIGPGDPVLTHLTVWNTPSPGTIERVSVDATGAEADDRSVAPFVTDDGRYVLFSSQATNLSPEDTHSSPQCGAMDVFVKNRQTGAVELVNVDTAGDQLGGFCGSAAQGMSADGRYVVFVSDAYRSTPSSYVASDAFVRDRVAHTTTNLTASTDAGAGNVAINADGHYVLLSSRSTNLDPRAAACGAFFYGLYVYDRVAQTFELVNVDSGGQVQCFGGGANLGTISADGRYVAFQTDQALVPEDLSPFHGSDVYVRDRQAASTTLVSRDGTGAAVGAGFPAISANGRYVAYESTASTIVPGDTNAPGGTYSGSDVFVYDRITGQTERVSVDASGHEFEMSRSASLSAEGRFVAFIAGHAAFSSGDHTGYFDVYVHDRTTGTTERVGSAAGLPGGGLAEAPALSSDGRFVTFDAVGSGYVPGDTNGSEDVFVHERGGPQCGNGVTEAGEGCDDGNHVSGDGCDEDCTPTGCGNAIVTAGEGCDDGNASACDGCSATCQVENPVCGDGVFDPCVEQCDDGNQTNGDGCDSNCRSTACGNGIVTAAEQCDDGNVVDGDCCSATCQGETGNPCEADGEACTIDHCDALGGCVFDARDPSCEGPFGDQTCSDLADNDGDTLVDAADPDCEAPREGPPTDATCSDGADNDGDALVDAADPDCQIPCPPEVCNGADDDCDALVDEGFLDSDHDGLADCVDQDQDGDGVLDGADNCPTVANSGQTDTDHDGIGDACDGDVPPTTNQPSVEEITVDAQFGPETEEWTDVTPVSFLNGDSKVYTSLDEDGHAIYLMYDFRLNTVPLAPGEEGGHIAFQVGGNSFFDVFFIQGGPNTNALPDPPTSQGGVGDGVRVLLNGQPFDNSAGCIEGAVDFNATSPNFPGEPHNVVELAVRLTSSPGGCYSPEPAFWSAALPSVQPAPPPEVGGFAAEAVGSSPRDVVVSESFVSIEPGGVVSVTPIVEGPSGDPTCGDGLDNDGDGRTDTADPDCGPDHFLCYSTAVPKGAARFEAIGGVDLTDQFGQGPVDVLKAASLCNPADKSGEDPGAPAHRDHLEGYQIKGERFAVVRGLTVTNQFGSLVVDALKPDRLLVPSAKSLQVSPPSPTAPAVDHFACYRVKVAKGAPHFVPIEHLSVEDQFGRLTVDLKKPRRLCNPVSKNGGTPGAETHPGHLLCYMAKTSKRAAKFTPVSRFFVSNEFGSETLTARKLDELCVPSAKTAP